MAGRQSDALRFNLVQLAAAELAGREPVLLRDRLMVMRFEVPRLSGDAIAELLTGEERELAARYDAEPPAVISQPVVWRWCHEVYCIE